MNIEIHSTQLIKQALLDATQFIIKRLEDSNQESYELVGYDDALLTLMEYHGYKLSQMDGDGEFTLYQNGAIIIHHVTRYEAYKEILDRIYDVVIYDI